MPNPDRRPAGSQGRPNAGSKQSRPDVQPREIKYFEGSSVRPELLDEEAREFAEQIRSVKTTQLRRFYNSVVQLQRRLDQLAEQRPGPQAREDAFERLRAEFKLLKARAHYAHARSERMFPEALLQFFVDHTHAVKTARDFDAFCQHFQAVVGFHQYYGED
jgi:CRISPR-associated protein Csm2